MANLSAMANANADKKPTVVAKLSTSKEGHVISLPLSIPDSDVREKLHEADPEKGTKARTTYSVVAQVYNESGAKLANPMRIKVTSHDKDGKPVEKIGLFSVATVNMQFRGFEE